jgi:ABC-type ATPase with predicted acetyltransferase domain
MINVAYETAAEISPRTTAVADAFGLGIDEEQKFVIYDNVEFKIGAKGIVYITGDSGSGKSVLLKEIKKDLGDEAVDMADIQLDLNQPLIETVGETVEEGLELLSRVGLNDAFLLSKCAPMVLSEATTGKLAIIFFMLSFPHFGWCCLFHFSEEC